MLRKTTVIVGIAAAAAALTFAFATSASTPREVDRYQGMTVRQWSTAAHGWMATANRRAADRNWLQKRLGQRVRELIALHRRFKAAPTRPPHYAQWLCIHSGWKNGVRVGGGEGAWNANTGNGFYGGLQFMQSTWERNGGRKYASRADLAEPLEQMWIAESAWRESGGSFSQWPNTARACGLL